MSSVEVYIHISTVFLKVSQWPLDVRSHKQRSLKMADNSAMIRQIN